MTVVQFNPLTSTVSPSLWHALTKLKIDVLKLSQDTVPISASYSAGRTVTDRETGTDVPLPSTLTVAGEAFEATTTLPSHSVSALGVLKNFNTIEEFKAADKQALFNDVAQEIWNSIKSSPDPSKDLSRFLLITFADLKKYKFYYWFAFPAFISKPAWEIEESGWQTAEDNLGRGALESIFTSAQSLGGSSTPAFFLARPSSIPSEYETAPLGQYATFFANTAQSSRIVAFLDPSAHPQHPGWPLRNALFYISYLHSLSPHSAQPLRLSVLCLRDSELPGPEKPWKSRFGIVSLPLAPGASAPLEEGGARPAAVGWEKNTLGKLAPRMADLAPMMDPTQLADQAVDLNLKLMRWRILPSLDLERVSSTRCLLLGAGTLGCYVGRGLMAWGVRTITFVDSGRVSFSNPVRQPLFEFEDCLNGGKPKAEAAAAALKRVFPGVNATGHTLSIPMPGHPIPSSPPSLVEQARADVEKLEKLIDEHDVVFLLMDSRESRWLPTLLGKAKGKVVINAALGFDTYLVMRHGARTSEADVPKLGCYYCNDIVAPADSLTDRTLDQMCTVTRPGLASIASSTAVELLVSLLQHPKGNHAPSPKPSQSGSQRDPSAQDAGDESSVLGLVPHQLRGYLAQFNNVLITGAAYERCTGCSEIVISAYEKEGFEMMLKAFNQPGYLEQLTGLDKLHAEGEAALESVDWEEEEGEGEDDF
ncbi:hypothetical protein BOTBODRAFT_28607 [Botryobasidium botryosum FD-172 SS1]|uniref:Ubiquitin-like modifier-activating enzyme ATG7 n=1 Tax=Botryobasidium botryosum (strain FD-172 SS1) TaxID=930990 RepID=A0A067N4Q1_BOTB1|nr:hypothetical protein BOTBODRAFT_28607 [Botryobasidium botryosum FD-172 SS1]